jgi:hypothetical protein
MTPIKTKAGDILALKVPSNAIKYARVRPMPGSDVLDWGNPNEMSLHANDCVKLPKGDWQFHGTISHDLKFSFDPEPFVDRVSPKNHEFVDTESASIKFIKLLESTNQILWSSPRGEMPELKNYSDSQIREITTEIGFNKFKEDLAKWQSLQDLVIKEDEIAVVLYNPNK